jgi:enoyl-CoA hydratase/carnithine racemase
MTKQMIEDEHVMGLDEAIEAEAQAQAICMMHGDFREAYDAAVKKRPPRFAGAPASQESASASKEKAT